MLSLFKVISILLSELVIFGAPVRSAFGLFLFGTWRSLVCLLFYLSFIFALYGSLDFPPSFNFIIFLVCSSSAIIFSRIRLFDALVGGDILIYVILALLALGALQYFNIHFVTNYFSNYYNSFSGRASGLSAEPSYFSWSIAFFAVHAFAVRKIGFIGLLLLFLVTFSINKSVTIIFAGAIFSLCFLAAIFSKTVYRPTIIFLIGYHLIERVSFSLGLNLLEHLYNASGSWREISHFLGLYGANIIGPFSGGLGWPDQMAEASYYLFDNGFDLPWIVWPWSFSAMVSLELGYFGLLFFLFWILYGCRGRVGNVYVRSTCIFLIVSGFLFVPKWMVFFFVLPRLHSEK